MTGPVLDQVRRAADTLAGEILASDAGRGAVWQVNGRPTSGKTSCLYEAADLLAESDLVPLLLAPPSRQRDSGPAALIDFGVGLKMAGQLNGELDPWVNSRKPWAERIARVQDWLSDNRERLVLLCDEPLEWEAGTDETGFFSGRAEDAARLFVEQSGCRRVVAGRLPQNVAARERIFLTPDPPDIRWLVDVDEWGPLADYASAIAEAEDELRDLTALELRLLVGYAAFTDVAAALHLVREGGRRPRLAQSLAALCSRRNSLHDLWSTWLLLAELRRSFDEELLDAVGARELDPLQADVLRRCLLFGEHELRLHDVLRAEARRWRGEQPAYGAASLPAAARVLHAHYRRDFEEKAETGDPSALTSAVEAFHFASISGDAELIRLATPFFSEQLDALGWSLSYIHRRYDDAAEVFRTALEWDETDDYAHHYLAFNLDRLARNPAEVGQHYERAIDLNPARVWWHSRLIVFLVHRGRISDAKARWEDAQVALGVDSREGDLFLFETLHLWVASSLVDRGELAFAREVLDDVPALIREDMPTLRPLLRRLSALEQAAELGAFVPADRLRPLWWQHRPELLQDRLGDDRALVRWLAGRVEAIDADGIHLHVAIIDKDQPDTPETARTSMDMETFTRLCRDSELLRDVSVGWYVEIGLYAREDAPQQGTETLVRLHEPRVDEDGAPIYMDTVRYLRPHLQVD